MKPWGMSFLQVFFPMVRTQESRIGTYLDVRKTRKRVWQIRRGRVFPPNYIYFLQNNNSDYGVNP